MIDFLIFCTMFTGSWFVVALIVGPFAVRFVKKHTEYSADPKFCRDKSLSFMKDSCE